MGQPSLRSTHKSFVSGLVNFSTATRIPTHLNPRTIVIGMTLISLWSVRECEGSGMLCNCVFKGTVVFPTAWLCVIRMMDQLLNIDLMTYDADWRSEIILGVGTTFSHKFKAFAIQCYSCSFVLYFRSKVKRPVHNGCVFCLFVFLIAIMEVHEDFFVYESGIYKHTDVNNYKPPQYRKHATHSVRITG